MNQDSLQESEKILFSLRTLYDKHGYSRYKMNKFEEYDLYAKNKDFLISDSVITFTDTNGKLLALKPDVTLSIVKNTKDECDTVQRLYYNENVYRVSKGTHSFKEIMQVGLEALGDIDSFCILEVMKLAADSLFATEQNCILEFSHLGILSQLILYVGIPEEEEEAVLRCIGEKNAHELSSILKRLEIEEAKAALLQEILSLYGTVDEVLPVLNRLLVDAVKEETLSEFYQIAQALNQSDRKEMFRIDFSIVSDVRYYNGFVFRGFAENIPGSVLSGGQYDRMMARMKKKSRAIGFAVYTDVLERLESPQEEFDTDHLILYDEKTPLSEIQNTVSDFTQKGESVLVLKTVPKNLKYKNLTRLTK